MAAGLLARNAAQKGLQTKPWVKTSLAPGSKVVTDYLDAAGLTPYLEQMGFYLVGYGCTTCIGNSGPLPEEVSHAIEAGDLIVTSVLSGNRNFEGRMQSEMFKSKYADVFAGDASWQNLDVPEGDIFAWDPFSTYIRKHPYFEGMTLEVPQRLDILGARALGVFGDSVTTDHISPAGEMVRNSPAGRYLTENDVPVSEYNTFGARRGNHEVMGRGTFGNIRLKNRLIPGVEGWYTRHLPDGEEMAIWEAAQKYQEEGVPLIILGGKEYGTGSSRDWAAKGPRILGVKAVIVETFERIHRSNLIGMGILPLQFADGATVESLGLTGEEVFDIAGISGDLFPRQRFDVKATAPDGSVKTFPVISRIDTPIEVDYYKHDGILPYVLRQLAAR
jgi:aconitate hydratase